MSGAVAVPHDVSQGKRKEGQVRSDLQVELAEILQMTKLAMHLDKTGILPKESNSHQLAVSLWTSR